MTMDNRYEEALKRAKQEYNTTKNVERKQLLEEYFPEIKESDDERIREEIKVILANTDLSQFALDYTFADMINWLEKQSKKQTYQSNERAWLYLVADVLTWREGIGQYLDDPRVQELAKKMQKEYSQKLHIDKQEADIDINPSEFEIRLNKLLKQFESLPKEDIVSSLSFYLNTIQNDGTYVVDEKQCKKISKLDIDDMVEKYRQEQFPLHNSSTASHNPYYPIGYIDNMIAQYRKEIDDILAKLNQLSQQGESTKIEQGKNYLCTKTHKYAGVEWIEGVKYYSPEDYSLVNQGCTYHCPKYSKEEHNDFFIEVEYIGCVEVDDVKPKFKVGDWVVYECGEDSATLQIKNIIYRTYEFTDDSTLDVVDQDSLRLWTIQDAKEGDVLFAENFGNIGGCVFLFNSIDNCESYDGNDTPVATGYCCIDITESGNTDFGIQGPDCIDIERVHPATKEQRDLLFQKMEESGYDFDFEKKELKKIEEDDDLTEFENGLADICRGWTGEEHGWKDYIIKNSFPLLALAKKQFDEYEKKSVEWSEEDEKMLHTIIADFKGFRHDNTSTLESHFTECIDWLKSLKDRIQPKQEWSDEDFKRIDYICDFVWKNRKGDTDEIYQQEQDVKWLKSLKDKVHPQSKE